MQAPAWSGSVESRDVRAGDPCLCPRAALRRYMSAIATTDWPRGSFSDDEKLGASP
jgi:hypothetical protein